MKILKLANTKSEEFKKWFGNWEDPKAFTSRREAPSSHAVDDEGKPRTYYHGTLGNFSEFETGREGTNSGTFGSWKANRQGFFFTPDPKHANAFTTQGEESAGGNIMPVYLKIESPLDFRNGLDEGTLADFQEAGVNSRWLRNFDAFHLDDEGGKHLVDTAKRLGYDGIIFWDENPETRESMETWVAFDPSQIKSAIGNTGKYNKEKRDITAEIAKTAKMGRKREIYENSRKG